MLPVGEEENVTSPLAFALLVDETDTLLLPVTLWLASSDRVPVAQPLEDEESVVELDPLALLVDDCDIDSVELPLGLFFAELEKDAHVLALWVRNVERVTVISEVDDAVCENPTVERGLSVVVREPCRLSLKIPVGDIAVVNVILLEDIELADTDEVDDGERLANGDAVGAFAVALVDGVAVTDTVEFGEPLADVEGDKDPVTVLEDERDCVPLTVGEWLNFEDREMFPLELALELLVVETLCDALEVDDGVNVPLRLAVELPVDEAVEIAVAVELGLLLEDTVLVLFALTLELLVVVEERDAVPVILRVLVDFTLAVALPLKDGVGTVVSLDITLLTGEFVLLRLDVALRPIDTVASMVNVLDEDVVPLLLELTLDVIRGEFDPVLLSVTDALLVVELVAEKFKLTVLNELGVAVPDGD